jgi:hypothetical protein
MRVQAFLGLLVLVIEILLRLFDWLIEGDYSISTIATIIQE